MQGVSTQHDVRGTHDASAFHGFSHDNYTVQALDRSDAHARVHKLSYPHAHTNIRTRTHARTRMYVNAPTGECLRVNGQNKLCSTSCILRRVERLTPANRARVNRTTTEKNTLSFFPQVKCVVWRFVPLSSIQLACSAQASLQLYKVVSLDPTIQLELSVKQQVTAEKLHPALHGLFEHTV